MQEIYQGLLAEEYELIQVNTTKKAENKLKKEKYDLMILDIVLPEESGDTFFAKLRNKKKYDYLNILVVTVLGDMTDEFKKIDPNVVCIAKPFDKKKFLGNVKKLIK